MSDLFADTDFVDEYENEDDSPASVATLLDDVVVSDTDWTTETVLSQLSKGNILLNPKFQRRDAWSNDRKSRFIESLLLGIPIPNLVLAETPNARGKYLVIDGKQRLLTLQKFASEEAPLRLSGLNIRTDLNGMRWPDLQGGAARSDDASAFENRAIRTTLIKAYKSEKALYTIFHRLNSGSVPLSPQELRHVLHPGPFIDFAFSFSEASNSLIHLLGKNGKPDFRMRDVEVLIRFFGFSYFLPTYQGDLKDFLDNTVKRLNESWNSEQNRIERLAIECERAIDATNEIFGPEAFSKATPDGFERRFNRAVFDVMTFYFKESSIREKAIQNKTAIVDAFVDRCRDPAFRRTLESTTKSYDATTKRLYDWRDSLEKTLAVYIPDPVLAQL